MTELATSRGSLWVRRFGSGAPRVVALHGFTLHGEMYRSLSELLTVGTLAPDLPGHGRSRLSPVSMGTAVDAVSELLATLDAPLLLGYSQGGRVALQIALTHPELIGALVLVATGPGLSGRDRKVRRVADEALAARIESVGLEHFISEWLANPLVATDRVAAAAREADRAIRMENTASGIAAALRGMGQASVSDSSGRLAELSMPVAFVAGENDRKYADFARAMAASRGERPTIAPGVGHNVILEAPERVAGVVNEMLPQR